MSCQAAREPIDLLPAERNRRLDLAGLGAPRRQGPAVPGLQHTFRSVVEPAVAEEETLSAGLQVIPVRVGDVVDGQGHAPAVGPAAPGGAGELAAHGRLPVNLGEGIGFRSAVIGADAQEQAGVLGQRCQQRQAPAGFGLLAPHPAHIRRAAQRQRVGVAAHHGLVAKPQHAGAQRAGGQLQRQVGLITRPLLLLADGVRQVAAGDRSPPRRRPSMPSSCPS